MWLLGVRAATLKPAPDHLGVGGSRMRVTSAHLWLTMDRLMCCRITPGTDTQDGAGARWPTTQVGPLLGRPGSSSPSRLFVRAKVVRGLAPECGISPMVR